MIVLRDVTTNQFDTQRMGASDSLRSEQIGQVNLRDFNCPVILLFPKTYTIWIGFVLFCFHCHSYVLSLRPLKQNNHLPTELYVSVLPSLVKSYKCYKFLNRAFFCSYV